MSENKEAPAATEQKTETPPPAPERKLAPGLFQGFTLGSTLEQGPQGNKVANLKARPMDYEKTYNESTRNQKMTADEIKAATAPKAPEAPAAAPAEKKE